MARMTLGSFGKGVSQSPSATTRTSLTGTQEQTDIWDEMLFGTDHILVNAVAGSGKSTTCIEGAKRVRAQSIGRGASVSYLAFNKHIQTEMQNRADGVLQARTFHSLGLSAVQKALGAVKVDAQRMWAVIEGMRKWSRGEWALKGGVKQLSAMAKQYDVYHRDSLAWVADTHGLDLGSEEEQDQVIEHTQLALERAAEFKRGELALIDYDDMCWLPVELGLKIDSTGMALIDEAQDLNPVQQWMSLRAGDRLAIVGDRHQAIYGFRGSDVRSMDNLAEMAALGWGAQTVGRKVIEYPLSYTRRCPVSHVQLAQVVVPGIHALPSAIDGLWGTRTPAQVIETAVPGELIICRTNAPLIEMAHKLLAAGKRAVIKGRDVGKGIVLLLEQAAGEKATGTLADALKQARLLTDMDVTRFRLMQGGKGEMRAAMAEDRLQCLLTSADGCSTITDLKRKLSIMFSDEDDAASVITLGTIHKVKGLEADKVTVLKPEQLPHPLATRPHEIQQEMNCLYVALTRSKRELWFVGDVPAPLR